MIAAFNGGNITTDGIVSLMLSAPVSVLWSNICLTMPLLGAFLSVGALLVGKPKVPIATGPVQRRIPDYDELSAWAGNVN